MRNSPRLETSINKKPRLLYRTKSGNLFSNPLIRNIVGQKHSAFDIRDLMDKRKILIADLSIGRMGRVMLSCLVHYL